MMDHLCPVVHPHAECSLHIRCGAGIVVKKTAHETHEVEKVHYISVAMPEL